MLRAYSCRHTCTECHDLFQEHYDRAPKFSTQPGQVSPPIQQALQPVLPSGPREVVADMSASFATCVVSAPLNLCWSYLVTTPATWSMTGPERARELGRFLRRQ